MVQNCLTEMVRAVEVLELVTFVERLILVSFEVEVVTDWAGWQGNEPGMYGLLSQLT